MLLTGSPDRSTPETEILLFTAARRDHLERTILPALESGKTVICDFKQANRPKKADYIQDYFLQLGAYTLAHDVVYKTKMNAGIILLCTVDNLFQEFKIEGSELEMYQNLFLGRVKKFYEINNT